ncbi:MAG: molybdate ABC transporter substrate-binding protein [bacterium]|nr:molybdate ABC transporter substrate-binding protein [bacterium]
MRRVTQTIFCLSCGAGLAAVACAPSANPSANANRAELTVFAAAGVADAIGEIAELFEEVSNVDVLINSASSGVLCKQAELGAPWDIYVPASTHYLDRLQTAELLTPGSRIRLASNQLVVVHAGADAPAWDDLSPLADAAFGSISIANPDHAPAGQYAEEALRRTGMWDDLQPRLVYANSVRLAAHYVADGGLAIGIVYATDARAYAERMTPVYRFPEGSHRPIVFEAAVGRGSAAPNVAGRFLDLAASTQARSIWERHGFVPPTQADQVLQEE